MLHNYNSSYQIGDYINTFLNENGSNFRPSPLKNFDWNSNLNLIENIRAFYQCNLKECKKHSNESIHNNTPKVTNK